MICFRRNHRMWAVSAVAAVFLFSLSLWEVASLAGPQSVLADPETTSSPSTIQSSSAPSYRYFLPRVSKDIRFGNPTGFGVQIYSSLNGSFAALPMAKKAHVAWIRWPIAWASIEPSKTTPDHFNWSSVDSPILAAYQAGFNLVVTVDRNPSWAATWEPGPIDRTDISEFAKFMGAIVERFDGDGWQDAPGSPVVDYWEFYNEPDAGDLTGSEGVYYHWGNYGAQYAQMLCAVRSAMKSASPRAQVVLGGIAYDWFTESGGPFVRKFLDDVLAAGGGRCLDVVNFHYYPSFEPQWSPYGPGVVGKASYLRGKLDQYGVGGLPMVVTEAGWHSNNYEQFPSTPEIQAGYVVKLFTQAFASPLKFLIWWTWSDYEIRGYWGDNGLLDQNLQPKLSAQAYQTAADKLGHAAFQRRLSASELGSTSVQAYLFNPAKPLYVLWSDSGSDQRVSLPGSSAQVINYVGNVTAQIADADDGQADGRVRITVGSSPIYVEVAP